MRQDKRVLFSRMREIQAWNGRMSEDEKQALSLFHWAALDWLRQRAEREALMRLVFVCNVALVLANKDCPHDYAGENNNDFAVTLTHLQRAIERGKRTGSWAMDSGLLKSIPAILALHDRQLEEVSRKVYERVSQYVERNS